MCREDVWIKDGYIEKCIATSVEKSRTESKGSPRQGCIDEEYKSPRLEAGSQALSKTVLMSYQSWRCDNPFQSYGCLYSDLSVRMVRFFFFFFFFFFTRAT